MSVNIYDSSTETLTQVPGTSTAAFTGATPSADGTKGNVPAPEAGEQGMYLKGDGTWSNELNTQIQTLANQISASIDAYSASTNYHVGDYCIRNNTLKRCIQDCTPASWDVNQSCFTDDTIVGALYDINNYFRDVTNTLISTNKLVGRIVFFNKLHVAELQVDVTGLTSGSTSWETVSTNSDVIKRPLLYVRGKATVGEFRMNNTGGEFTLQVNLRGEAVTDTTIHCTYIYQ